MTREEALQAIKAKMDYYESDKRLRGALETLIPELAESEDERILASIADCVGLMGEDGNVFSNHNVTKVQVLSWLKKQKETLHISETCKENPDSFIDEDERLRGLLVWQVHRNIEDETNDLAQSVYDGIKGHDPDLEESIEDWKRCLAYLEKQKDLDKMIVVSPEVWDNAISDAFENGKKEGEKQKENPKSADSIPSDCTSDAKYEDRWHKVGDSLPDNGREVLAKDKLGNTLLARYDGEGWDVSVYDDEDYRCHNGISKWCEIPSEKQKEQKPIIQDVKLNDAVYDYVRDHFIAGADFTPEYIKRLMENAFFAGVDYYLLKQESESCEPDTNVEKVIEDVIRVYGKTQGEWVGGYDVDTLIVNLRRAFNKKEQKPVDYDHEMWKNCEANFEGGKKEVIEHPEKYGLTKQKPAEYLSKEKVFAIMKKLTSLSFCVPLGSDEEKQIHEITCDVRSLLDYPIEQKPTSISCGHENDAEWGQEDKEKIVTISEIIEHCTTIPYSGGTLTLNKEYKKELLCFIRTLRPSWKPSKEQMDRLFSIVAALRKDYCDDMADFLANLYADLRKLGVKEDPEYYQHFVPDC